MAADKAARDNAAAEKAAADKAIAEKALADKAAMTNADADRATVDAIKTPTGAARPRQDAVKTTAEAAFASSAAESRMAFVYGLISGPIIFCFGGVVFLLLNRRRNLPLAT